MPKNTYPTIKEIARLIRVNFEKEVPRGYIENQIRERIGAHPKTVETYMRLLADMDVIAPGPHFNVFLVFPAHNERPASPENQQAAADYAAGATARRLAAVLGEKEVTSSV